MERYFLTPVRVCNTTELALVYEVNHGKRCSREEICKWPLDRIQAEFPSITKEVTDELTPEKCLDMGYYVKAIQVYRNQHDCRLTEARAAVDHLRDNRVTVSAHENAYMDKQDQPS